MADILASFYGFSISKEEIKEEIKKPDLMKTRRLQSSKGVANYASFTRYDIPKCIFFQSILQSKYPSTKNNNEIVGNFVCNMFLPLPMAGSVVFSSRKRFTNTRELTGFPEPINRIEERIVGSSSEGLFLPEIHTMDGLSFKVDGPDQDKIYIFSNLRIGADRRSTQSFAFLETSPDSPPLFVRLKYNRQFRMRDEKNCFDLSKILTADGYIHRVKLIRSLRMILKNYVRNYEREYNVFKNKDGILPDVKFSQHGPAITVEVEDKTTNLKHSADYVISLPCTTWPKQARQWSRRERHWPSKSMVKTIIQQGCHVVPKPHNRYKSNAPRRKCISNPTEFILSFSPCDRILSHSLTLNQRRSYMLFKFVFKYHIKRVKRGLSNYMCKLTFFWLCEKRHESEWREDNPLECLMDLLGDFKSYLTTGYLPNYYIPEHNLMSNMSEESRKACVKDVDIVMDIPCEIILNLSENYRFLWLSRDVSVKSVLQDLISDRNITYTLLQSYILKFLSVLLDKGEIYLVLAILCEIWCSDISTDTQHAINVLERLVCNHYDNEHIVCFKGLLAALYHQRGEEYVYKENIVDYSKMDKSLNLFNEILDNVGEHIWIYGAYYDLMYAMTRYEDLVKHFLSNVYCNGSRQACKLNEPGIYTALSPYTSLTPFSDHFTDVCIVFVVPSTAYILYKLILSYKALAEKPELWYMYGHKMKPEQAKRKVAYMFEARKVLIHLEKWIKQKCQLFPELNDEFMHFMLGMVASELGEVTIAKNSFREAVRYECTFAGVVIEGEPAFHESTTEGVQEHNERFHPYLRKNNSQMSTRRMKANQIPQNMRFRNCAVHVGSYSHSFGLPMF